MRNQTLAVATLLLVSQAGANAAEPVGPVPIAPNTWTIPSTYPPESLREKPLGVVAFRLEVGRDGVPTSCTVSEPSGAAEVDQRTCEWLVKRARFKPARNSSGDPVSGHYETRFGWTLKPGGLAPMPVPGSLTMTAIIEPDGRVTDCKVKREGMQPGGQFDTWCGDLQTYAPEPDPSGRMIRRRLVVKRSLSYEDVPGE